ncbi:hypothetical protein EMQ25_13635 [Arsenicitalea aurantiaca]|uniref:Organic solvent tolerance-like N-terminal domain-containing protein n=1 Tax=Arsenicitalea aurantiaca TaxID=1783274 RepID=A0A433X8C6_9HYPH|nr:LptA/OstA family protein [Arsenicitalea aurantiaca]RUT30347.1 hypothetical protein EMQ25_13635 [Arsenicitalea aurantiaca]
MKRMLAAIGMGLALCGAALGQANVPVEISADSFVVEEATGRGVFSGNVRVERGNLSLEAAEVSVVSPDGSATAISSFEATGSVRIRTPDQRASGERARYDPTTQILRLSGNVEVTNATGTLRGPELVINLATNVSTFSSGGSGGRVTGVFTPQ